MTIKQIKQALEGKDEEEEVSMCVDIPNYGRVERCKIKNVSTIPVYSAFGQQVATEISINGEY